MNDALEYSQQHCIDPVQLHKPFYAQSKPELIATTIRLLKAKG